MKKTLLLTEIKIYYRCDLDFYLEWFRYRVLNCNYYLEYPDWISRAISKKSNEKNVVIN